MATVFFSYSHVDEDLRDKLEVHLTMLKREGIIETWHDRRLKPGDAFDAGIMGELERADVILLLVSPDFLASKYCYEDEMGRALERNAEGTARVIPVILRHCDWMSSPFGRLQAVPRNGRPIKAWPDIDEAFLDVTKQIRSVLPAAAPPAGPSPRSPAPVASGPRSSNLSLRKTFSEIDHDRFLDGSFEFIAKFFENSLSELRERNQGIDCTFRRLDANRFTAVVYRDSKAISRGSVVRGGMFGRGMTWAANDLAETNSCNDHLTVENDDQSIYLRAAGMSDMGRRDEARKLTEEGAAEYLWTLLIRPLQSR